ncbi:MAG: universal stress protein [candidate division WOR-3 bacterium]
MFNRIVFLITLKPEGKNLAIELAKKHRARLILLSLIDPRPLLQIIQDTGREESLVREELESKAWSDLFKLESEIKQLEEMEVAVTVEEGSVLELQPFLKSVKADLLILPTEWLRFYNYTITEKFLADLPCPVLIIGKP